MKENRHGGDESDQSEAGGSSAGSSPDGHLLPEDLVAELADEVKVIAARLFERESPGHTLQATALVSELWLRLSERNAGRKMSREAFLAFATKAIRHILVDHARRKLTQKRGGDRRRSTGEVMTERPSATDGQDWFRHMLELDDEINLLESAHSRAASVFELRYIGGMSFQQIADLLDVGERTARREWAFARDWMRTRMSDDEALSPTHAESD